MIIEYCTITSIEKVKPNIYLLKLNAPKISSRAKAGQFCNIKVSETDFPLLRRPFSFHDVDGEEISFLFDIHGEGTKILSQKKIGDKLDILGPLGNGFDVEGEYKTAIIVAGGIGVAPFPFLMKNLKDKSIYSFLGARNENYLYQEGLKNVLISTDDGSVGFKGNVVDLLKNEIEKRKLYDFRIFACGPTPMLKAIQKFSNEKNFSCQLSVESAMACGFGICQGCPIETSDDSYKLICKDGPVFYAEEIKL